MHTRPESSAAASSASLPSALRTALYERTRGEVALPFLPDTALQVMAACQDDNSDLTAIAALITRDQSLAMHLLRIANSAVYAPREPIVSLPRALGRMGVITVRETVLALSVKGRVFSVPGYQTRLRELWMHSAATAVYAREVALCADEDAQAAFVCGLLHDVGMPIAMQALCDLAKEKDASLVPAAIMEAAMAEFHQELGARIANSWKLGARTASAIRHHHQPTESIAHRAEALITFVADQFAYWALDERLVKEDFRPPAQQLAALGLSESDVAMLLAKRGRVLEITESLL